MPEIEDFTEAERERIRQALIRYAETYKLGTIVLARRISKANPFGPGVHHRTVARFIKNEHETNPLLIKWCKVFLQKVAPDPLKEMAEGLIRFYGPNHLRDRAGDYSVWLEGGDRETPQALITITDDDEFYRVRLQSEQDHKIWDGILLANRSTASLFLRNRLTGLPCVAMLSPGNEGFFGTIIESTPEGNTVAAQISMVRLPSIDTSILFSPVVVWNFGIMDELFASAYAGNVKGVEELLARYRQYSPYINIDINAFEETTGLTLLHIAIGRNHLELTRFLLANGATIMPDRRGRWPSLIAAECEASDELYDLVADAEIAAEEKAKDV